MTTPERDQVTRLEDENAQLRALLQIAESALRADDRTCSVCHRPLMVRQELDHLDTPTGWVCMPCAERSGAAVAWAPLQGGDLPQTPR